MNRQTLAAGIAISVVLLAGVLYLVSTWIGGSPESQTAPITGVERAEEARGIIAEIEQTRTPAERGGAGAVLPDTPPEEPSGTALVQAPVPEPQAQAGAGADVPTPSSEEPGEATDLDSAFERAQAFQRAGQLADAQLLYFYGARSGHAGSAFELGTMNDPNHHSPQTSLLPEPDAFQAYRWYSAARDQGMPSAGERLERLREWAEAAAQAGDTDAERLLLQWERNQ